MSLDKRQTLVAWSKRLCKGSEKFIHKIFFSFGVRTPLLRFHIKEGDLNLFTVSSLQAKTHFVRRKSNVCKHPLSQPSHNNSLRFRDFP